ncbi:hypothetical protein [Leifsonia aquatica]|uniref:hypothetical protein n=1 Tax=Leifsonia aquatica TaxID=144185 RepID=UPI0013B3CCAE|nr:hypothetical protein [Leifsonia aquatica]
MSDWDDETLDEWRRAAAAFTGQRLNAMDQRGLGSQGERAPAAPTPAQGRTDAQLEDADGND